MRREPFWVKLFLRELSRMGNVRLAAERAGVDFSTAYQRRKRHAEFAERWEGALQSFALRHAQDEREAQEAPSPGSPAASPSSPPPTFQLHDRAAGALKSASPPRGEDVVARPDELPSGECFPSIRSGKLVKGSGARWGKRADEAFLLELTINGNVSRAAKAAGFSTQAAYKRRLKDRRFAAAWDMALETGKARIQSYLVEAATRTFDPDELPIGDEPELPKVSISEAINIARLKGGASTPAGKGGWSPGGWTDQDAGFETTHITREDWEEAKQRVVDRITRVRERQERQERETGLCSSCGQPLPARAPPDQATDSSLKQ